MAKVEITKEQVRCDYPGCEARVTELGGKMSLTASGPEEMPADTEEMSIDLCRQHRRSLEAWWKRGES